MAKEKLVTSLKEQLYGMNQLLINTSCSLQQVILQMYYFEIIIGEPNEVCMKLL